MYLKQQTSDIVVIGGGAAGMMAAIATLQDKDCQVILLEKNDILGKKLGITGKGRCNVTNDSDINNVMSNIPVNSKFLYGAINRFPPQSVMKFFEEQGVPLKTERGNRVFPVSDNARDIVFALKNKLISSGVRIIRDEAKRIVVEDNHVVAVETSTSTISCKRVILCTGGMSYQATGSTGDGYEMSRALGHSITDIVPSLVPLECEGTTCKELQGLSLKNISLKVKDSNNKTIFNETGEMLFTHFGMSGPLVLSASSHMHDYNKNKYTVSIDLKPALDEKKLDQRILRDFEEFSNREFKNSLDKLLPRLMIPVIIEKSGILPNKAVNSITKEERKHLVGLLKDLCFTILGPRPINEAIVTSGGVCIKEINPSTMESKIVKGLFFAGELIDVDAYTGGFNLQIAWSTGHLAGISAVKDL